MYALALGAQREHPQPDTFGQNTHWEHRAPTTQSSDDQLALNDVIVQSEGKAEARKLPKTAIAMLELYGTERESQWFTQVAKGE